MRHALHIGWRAALASALVLSVLLVPLLHSAHFHEGDADGDASISATCVVCQVAGGHIADCNCPAALGDVVPREAGATFDVPGFGRSILLATSASRAPPSLLS